MAFSSHDNNIKQEYMKDTICALATTQGGALNVIRVSGLDSISIVDKLFVPRKGAPLAGRKSHTVAFGDIYITPGEPLDEVLVTLMRGPHSYTSSCCSPFSKVVHDRPMPENLQCELL